ncbi:hypothetical protein ScalyP_jg5236 [Parmales sp. scaly parma]|nr:hypothetical protein ScalyP_jg5236 [Parmales sp. scaly parma]
MATVLPEPQPNAWGMAMQLPPEQQQAMMAQMMAAQAANPQLMAQMQQQVMMAQMMAAQAANPQLMAAMMAAQVNGKRAQCCVCKGSKTRQYRFGFLERGRGKKNKIVKDNEMTDTYHYGQVLADFDPSSGNRGCCAFWSSCSAAPLTILILIIMVGEGVDVSGFYFFMDANWEWVVSFYLLLYFLLKGAFSWGSECVRCEGTGEVTYTSFIMMDGTDNGSWGAWYPHYNYGNGGGGSSDSGNGNGASSWGDGGMGSY